MGKKAIYPGSFDPVTFGHVDLIERASLIFDDIVIAVANNLSKEPLFTTEERVDMLKEATKDIKGVHIETFDGLVTEYAERQGSNVLIRGLRMLSDFEYELQMALMNRRLKNTIETLFLMPSEGYAFISSSLIKEATTLGADVTSFVPEYVAGKLKDKLGK
ncbi:MAG: pantetheine-phosphate adenylyltransferase [Lysobacterales bacterium]